MNIERTEAIVLQTFPSRERDKLVVFLTPHHGKRKGWAYAARSNKNRFGAALEPLSKVTIGYVEREGDEVVRIESIDLIRSLFPAQQNLVSSIAATYLAETIDTFAPAGDPAELLYRLLDTACGALLNGSSPLAIVAYAEIWTLRIAGTFPSTKACFECHEPLAWPLRFNNVSNGFVCEACAGRNTELVPNDLSVALTDLQLPVGKFAERQVSEVTLFDLRSLARTIRRNFLGHELKSHDILGSVLVAR